MKTQYGRPVGRVSGRLDVVALRARQPDPLDHAGPGVRRPGEMCRRRQGIHSSLDLELGESTTDHARQRREALRKAPPSHGTNTDPAGQNKTRLESGFATG